MEQRYIQAYRLLEEVNEIDAIPDSVEKAKRWRQWKVKAQAWASQPRFSPRRSQQVQSGIRLVEQSHDAVSQIALKN